LSQANGLELFNYKWALLCRYILKGVRKIKQRSSGGLLR
jgi:hypothetical protein